MLVLQHVSQDTLYEKKTVGPKKFWRLWPTCSTWSLQQCAWSNGLYMNSNTLSVMIYIALFSSKKGSKWWKSRSSCRRSEDILFTRCLTGYFTETCAHIHAPASSSSVRVFAEAFLDSAHARSRAGEGAQFSCRGAAGAVRVPWLWRQQHGSDGGGGGAKLTWERAELMMYIGCRIGRLVRAPVNEWHWSGCW